jgi:hypothetical protein
MRSLAYALPPLPGFDSPKSFATWPVWSGSTYRRGAMPPLLVCPTIPVRHGLRERRCIAFDLAALLARNRDGRRRCAVRNRQEVGAAASARPGLLHERARLGFAHTRGLTTRKCS